MKYASNVEGINIACSVACLALAACSLPLRLRQTIVKVTAVVQTVKRRTTDESKKDLESGMTVNGWTCDST